LNNYTNISYPKTAPPFGMMMQERSFTSNTNENKFGFNGKEMDNETYQGSIAFEARIYDARLSRFLSTDPLMAEYTWQSSYVFAANSPVFLIDILGMGPGLTGEGKDKGIDLKGKGSSPMMWQNTGSLNVECEEAVDKSYETFEGQCLSQKESRPTDLTKIWKSFSPEERQAMTYGYMRYLESKLTTSEGENMWSTLEPPLYYYVFENGFLPQWVENGISQLGVSEHSDCNTVKGYYNTLKRKGPTKCTGGTRNQSAWCAAFVSFTLHGTGYGSAGDPGAFWWGQTRTAQSTKRGLVATGSTWGKAYSEPFVGAIVVFKSNSHVGILIGKTETGQYLMLGGNQNDQVNITLWGNNKIRARYLAPSNYAIPSFSLPIFSDYANGKCYSNKLRGGRTN
jgi:RHS repeat-associated protein